jgi:two-component system, cell cycle sensor histidine kinase and response regulator CckA
MVSEGSDSLELGNPSRYLDLAKIIFLAIDSEGKITFINQKGCEIIGSSRETLLAANWFNSCIPERMREEVRTVFDRLMIGELTLTEYHENPIVTSSGEERLIAWHNSLIMDDKGKISGTFSSGEDITERRSVEEEFRFLSTVVRQTTEGIAVADLQGDLIFVNAAWCSMHGYDDPDELRGKNLAIFHNEKQVREQVLPFNEQLKLSGTYSGEVGHLTKDGKEFPTLMTSTILNNPEGIPVAMVGLAKDISESKKAAEQAKEAKDLFSKFMDQLPACVFIKDNNLRTIYANEQLVKLFNTSTWADRTADELFPGETGRLMREDDLSALRGGFSVREETVIDPDGSEHVFWTRKFRIDRENKDSLLGGIALDITDRIRAEDQLRLSKERYQNLIDHLGEGICTIDSDHRITFVNPAACGILGERSGNLIGKKLMDFLGYTDLDFLCESSAERAKTERSVYELDTVKPDGKKSHLLVTATTQPSQNGDLSETLLLLRDITDLKRVQEEQSELQTKLMQIQKMEAVGKLAGGVAHDFNNTLSIILGYGELLLLETRGNDTLYEKVKEIVEAGHRSADLTRKLLGISRKHSPEMDVVDLNNVVRGLEKMLRSLVGEDTVIDISLSPVPVTVMADRSQLEQIIMNLIFNSKQAIERDGRISITTDRVHPENLSSPAGSDPAPGDFSLLSVSDNGCGMDADTLDRIFDPFFTTKIDGTGLGLSNVHDIIQKLGGYISPESEPGEGSVFRIWIPYCDTEASSGSEVHSKDFTTHRGEGGLVLVVEDEVSICRLLSSILSDLNYQVESAHSGEEALHMVKEKGLQPDLLLTDLVMTGIDGFELSRILRVDRPDLPVLYISGHSGNTGFDELEIEPNSYFIRKPFRTENIASTIKKILTGEFSD